jgi:hypothetical protein
VIESAKGLIRRADQRLVSFDMTGLPNGYRPAPTGGRAAAKRRDVMDAAPETSRWRDVLPEREQPLAATPRR